MNIISIDAGGTKCRACLYGEKGNLLAESVSGPGNLFSNFEGAINSILDAAYDVLRKAPFELSLQDCMLSVGAAGAGIPRVKDQFSHWQHPFKKALLNTDLMVSTIAANKGDDCAFVVVGTGSSVAIYRNGNLKQYGGYGFTLGDEASGAWIAKKTIAWYLASLEGLHSQEQLRQENTLLNILLPLLGNDLNAIIEQYAAANAGEYGQLTPHILAVSNSPFVTALIQQGCAYLANILRCNAKDLPVFIGGGLAHIYQEALHQHEDLAPMLALDTPNYGAYMLARNEKSLLLVERVQP